MSPASVLGTPGPEILVQHPAPIAAADQPSLSFALPLPDEVRFSQQARLASSQDCGWSRFVRDPCSPETLTMLAVVAACGLLTQKNLDPNVLLVALGVLGGIAGGGVAHGLAEHNGIQNPERFVWVASGVALGTVGVIAVVYAAAGVTGLFAPAAEDKAERPRDDAQRRRRPKPRSR